MKITEGLEIIEKGWIPKPKGFRVRFHQQTQEGVQLGYSPPPDAAPLNSDVTAWRYAWKLWQATQARAQGGEIGALYNITVVDDGDQPVLFYATGEFETYSPKEVEPVNVPAEDSPVV
jgi:hypothetical protein